MMITRNRMNYRNHLSPPQFPAAWASAWGEDRYGLWMTLEYQGAELTFRWIEPGTFMMGSPPDYDQRYADEDFHAVTLTQGFWLADSPVTQAFWQAVAGENPSHFKGDALPVEQVSWDDVQGFIAKLNQLHPDLQVRLPWEAEWEYACRAGTTTPFHFGEAIDADKANYRGVWNTKDYKEWGKDAPQKTTAIKSYPPNHWGLYDLHGNVWEWCQDSWREHLGTEAVSDPRIEADEGTGEADEAGLRVVRGGSWRDNGRHCRSANRYGDTPDERNLKLGCRLVLRSAELK